MYAYYGLNPKNTCWEAYLYKNAQELIDEAQGNYIGYGGDPIKYSDIRSGKIAAKYLTNSHRGTETFPSLAAALRGAARIFPLAEACAQYVIDNYGWELGYRDDMNGEIARQIQAGNYTCKGDDVVICWENGAK